MSRSDRRTYPGLFAGEQDLAAAQRAAAQYADAQPLPQRALDDERELRYRALARSAFWWIFLGVPAVSAVFILVALLASAALRSATGG
jgi:hypothetical protein